MKRLYSFIGIGLLMLLLSGCGGGGDNGDDGLDNGPLTVQLLRATPSSGSSPLRVMFTVNISGGTAPYYYSWDYNMDGAVDDYVNQTYDRTISVQNDYYLRASDTGGSSIYKCQLKVMDSSGDPAITPDPLTVTVLAGSGMSFGEQTGWLSDTTDEDGDYVAIADEPVYFRAQPLGGTAPYRYQWDFDGDGNVDSSVAAPQYTFTYDGIGVDIHTVTLTVLDDNGEKVIYEYLVPVQGKDSPPDPTINFDAILDSSPQANDDGEITLNWAPSGTIEGVYTEPQIDLSVLVDPAEPGQPPYEYYWDFENDGKFDSQDPSPTLPYYDYERKILVNPYVHALSSKNYTLRVMVIDSAGRMEQFNRTIISRNIDGSTGLLTVVADYGFGNPLQPFVALTSGDAINTEFAAKFNIAASGSPGTVEYQFDADGDGVPEDVLTEDTDDWDTPGNGAAFTIDWKYKGIGYYPASITVRTVDTQNNQIDIETVQMPLSIVKVAQLQPDGTLDARVGASMSPAWDIQAGGGNGSTLVTREAVITGGSRGNTALRTNISVRQTFSAPADSGSPESVIDSLATQRLQMNQERWGHWQWTQNPTQMNAANYYIMGGQFFLGGMMTLTAQSELSSASSVSGSPWAMSYEMGPEGYLTLSESGGDFIGNIEIPGKQGYNYYYVFVSGVQERTGSIVNQVSRRFISFDPGRPLKMPPKPAYVLCGPDIPTGRYDHAVVYDGQYYYVIGGRVASGESVRTVEAYDMNAHIWRNLPPMQDMRSGHTACLIGGKIYVIGGGYYPPNESDFSVVTTAEVYNPDTGTWSYTAAPAGVANNACATALPGPGAVSGTTQDPNTIWYFGGEDNTGAEQSGLYELVYYYTVFPPAT